MSNPSYPPEAISMIRSFSRSVTHRVGVFTDRFLGRDRPLAEARLLFEIGRGGNDVRVLRTRLGFDSGYLSRLLRSLEKQNLIEVVPQPTDRRTRHARLTATGESELAELDRRGDDFARTLLAPLTEGERQRMVRAMDEVERLLRLSATVLEVEDPTSSEARWCVEQYFAELAARFDQGFDPGQSISADPGETRPPRGVFLVARLDGQPVGCGALKTLEEGIGTIKRMWIDESARGIGLGRHILFALEDQARQLGFHRLRLETNRVLTEAQSLYRRNGYEEVSPFNNEPYAHHWFEKNIQPAPTTGESQ